MSGGRRTTAEEDALFEHTVRAQKKADQPKPPTRPTPPPAPKRPAVATPPPRQPPERRPEIMAEGGRAPVPGLDRRSAERLAQGRLEIEARLDLHGRRLEEAHQALVRFVQASHAGGRRCVLVVTGKGGAWRESGAIMNEDAPGVLRRALPRWLATPPLADKVLAARPAQPKDGGGGAFYVLLRRPGR